MKFMATLSPQSSGIGRGCKGPVGFRVVDLFCKHLVHEEMYTFSKVSPHVLPVIGIVQGRIGLVSPEVSRCIVSGAEKVFPD